MAKSSGVPDAALRSEEDARLELQTLRDRIAHLEGLIGPSSSQPDVAEFAQRLERKEAELKVLEAKAKEKDSVAQMMYGEVDRLSAAWTLLDEQNRSKVFKLAESEEKILKAVHEVRSRSFGVDVLLLTQKTCVQKAKADNKYFAAMRTNEALKGENVLLEKVTQKQSATIEKLSDELKAATSRLTTLEREVSAHERSVNAHKAKVAGLTSANDELSGRAKGGERQLQDVRDLLAERTRQYEAEVAARNRAEEQSTRASKELERTSSKLDAVKSGTAETAEVSDLKDFNENLTVGPHLVRWTAFPIADPEVRRNCSNAGRASSASRATSSRGIEQSRCLEDLVARSLGSDPSGATTSFADPASKHASRRGSADALHAPSGSALKTSLKCIFDLTHALASFRSVGIARCIALPVWPQSVFVRFALVSLHWVGSCAT